MTRSHWIVLALTCSFCLCLLCCNAPTHPSNQIPDTTPMDNPTPEPLPVELQSIESGTISSYVETTSNIMAETDILIYPKISGQIVRIPVHEGDAIEKDQLLVELDGSELSLRVQQAEVTRSQAKDKYERIKTLYEAKMVSAETFQDAEYAFKSADVSYRLISLDHSHTRINSPIEGIITEKHVSIGDMIQPSIPLLRMVDPDSLRIEVFLPEREVKNLQIGMTVEILPDSIPDQIFKGEIQRIHPTVDPKTGTVKIVIGIIDARDQLSSGMFVRVRILKERKQNVLLVPKKAIIRQNSHKSVFIMTPANICQRRSLETGLEDAGFMEIIQGLSEGEKVIVVGQNSLEDGQPVIDVQTSLPSITPNVTPTQNVEP